MALIFHPSQELRFVTDLQPAGEFSVAFPQATALQSLGD